MAGISLFLPFLPLLPMQILLTNLLTDLPEMTIATDNVEEGAILKPRRWDLKFVKRFMITFGILSSVFDFVTFGILIHFLNANEFEFRTGWFVESVISASLIVLVVRTRRSIFKSRPGKYLSGSVLIITLLTLILPYTPLGNIMGFSPLPFYFLIIIFFIVISYIICTELLKKLFYRNSFN
jgi:P-type Mg2+ transporter